MDKAAVKCFKCKCLGNLALECSKREANDKEEKKSGKQTAFRVRDAPTGVNDSGATSHMCHSKDMMNDA